MDGAAGALRDGRGESVTNDGSLETDDRGRGTVLSWPALTEFGMGGRPLPSEPDRPRVMKLISRSRFLPDVGV